MHEESSFIGFFFSPSLQGTDNPGFQFFLESYNSLISGKKIFSRRQFSSVLSKCRNVAKRGEKALRVPRSASLDAAARTWTRRGCITLLIPRSALGCTHLHVAHRQLPPQPPPPQTGSPPAPAFHSLFLCVQLFRLSLRWNSHETLFRNYILFVHLQDNFSQTETDPYVGRKHRKFTACYGICWVYICLLHGWVYLNRSAIEENVSKTFSVPWYNTFPLLTTITECLIKLCQNLAVHQRHSSSRKQPGGLC